MGIKKIGSKSNDLLEVKVVKMYFYDSLLDFVGDKMTIHRKDFVKLAERLLEANTIKDNAIELLKEDIECVHKYLDEKLTPRKDSYDRIYSIIGRIFFLEKYCSNPMIIKSDGICPTTNKHCDDECCPVGAECNISSDYDSPVTN